MKISAIQLNVAFNDPEKNRKEVEKKIEAVLSEQSSDTIVLPEMWNVSFFPKEPAEKADTEGRETKRLLQALAAKYNVNIVGGSVATKKRGKLYNTSYSFDRKGVLLQEYDKVHLFSPSYEHQVFTAGKKPGVFELDGVKVGIATCYDLRFVEWIRKLALMDIDILFVPAAWPHPRVFHWQTLLRARAIENQLFVVGVNSTGETDELSFCGHSMILNPLGETLAEAAEGERILSAGLDLSSRKKIQETINVFRDRRPELY